MNWGSMPDRQAALPGGRQGGHRQGQLGDSSEVDLVAPRNLAVTLPAGLASGNRLKIRYRGRSKRRSPRASMSPTW